MVILLQAILYIRVVPVQVGTLNFGGEVLLLEIQINLHVHKLPTIPFLYLIQLYVPEQLIPCDRENDCVAVMQLFHMDLGVML
jgi:hypothetical protein